MILASSSSVSGGGARSGVCSLVAIVASETATRYNGSIGADIVLERRVQSYEE